MLATLVTMGRRVNAEGTYKGGESASASASAMTFPRFRGQPVTVTGPLCRKRGDLCS